MPDDGIENLTIFSGKHHEGVETAQGQIATRESRVQAGIAHEIFICLFLCSAFPQPCFSMFLASLLFVAWRQAILFGLSNLTAMPAKTST